MLGVRAWAEACLWGAVWRRGEGLDLGTCAEERICVEERT